MMILYFILLYVIIMFSETNHSKKLKVSINAYFPLLAKAPGAAVAGSNPRPGKPD